MLGVREKTNARQAATAGLSIEMVKALSEQRREPAWLRELRLEAWATFERLPMPTLTTEGWRRTDIGGLRLDEVLPLSEPRAVARTPRNLPSAVQHALASGNDVAGLLVEQDASPVYRRLAEEVASQGVLLVDLAHAVHEHEALVREHLASVVSATEDKFSALHAAFWNSGALVYVPRGVAVQVPLHLLTFVGREGLGAFPHSLIVADAGADVTVLDEQLSAGRQCQGLASGVVEVVAGPDARVRYVHMQRWGREQWAFSTMRARVERNASVHWLMVALGGWLTKANVESRLVGQGAETNLLGLIFGDGQQHFDHYTLQAHDASDTRSDLLFKAVLQDRASSNYTGMVRIAPNSRRCDANQESRNLLLSRGAKADADPRLEILNSDVLRASHGATVGPVDQELLYYVMTRGLARREAERLLVEAFFEPILAKVPLESLRKKLWATIARRLGGGESRA